MSRTVQNAIAAALSSPTPARNFVTGDDAKSIADAAKADGRVTPEEIKLVTDLNLQPTFFNDDLFGSSRDWNFEKPTASGNGYGQISEFLRENSVKHAVEAALHGGGPMGFNFVDTREAEGIVSAAKADGRIDASEREQLVTLGMGWTYHADSDQKDPGNVFEKPTLSLTAGQVINAALREEE